MDLDSRKILVTGGAGFIGSNLTERLIPENEVVVFDNLSGGKRDHVPPEAEFREIDLTDRESVFDGFDSDFDIVFHLSANSDIRKGNDDLRLDLEQNTVATNNLLEAMKANNVTNIAFTSSSTVYGEEPPLPTPEDYGPLEPISLYGATKLGAEGLCTAYAGSFGFEVSIFRFANIVGGRGHGVVPDFVEKLQDDFDTLEILGDGEQRKSYLHVSDCVEAILQVVEEGEDTVYNIGSNDTVSVTRIAEIVSDELGVSPEFEYTGGDRGWKGDVPKMRLSIKKLKNLGWEPSYESEEAVRKTVCEILD